MVRNACPRERDAYMNVWREHASNADQDGDFTTLNSYGAYAVDAIFAFAHAFDATIRAHGAHALADGETVLAQVGRGAERLVSSDELLPRQQRASAHSHRISSRGPLARPSVPISTSNSCSRSTLAA